MESLRPENPLTPCQPVAVRTKKCPWSSSPVFPVLRSLETISLSLSQLPWFNSTPSHSRHQCFVTPHSELLTSAPAGSSRRTGGTGEEKEEEEGKVPALPAGSTVELVDLGLPERGTRSCAYASTLTIHNPLLQYTTQSTHPLLQYTIHPYITIHNPRSHSRRAILQHCPSQVRCRSNIEKDRITDGNTYLISAIMDDLSSLEK